MNLENISQVVKFPSWVLLPEPLSEGMQQLLKDYLASQDEEKKKALNDLFDSSDDVVLKSQLDALGIKYPWDLVDCKLSLGALLFDITLAKGEQAPKAPLAAHQHQKKYADLATAYLKPEFEVPGWAFDITKEVIVNEDLWNKVNCTVSYDKDGKTEYMTLSNQALNYFPGMVARLVEIFA